MAASFSSPANRDVSSKCSGKDLEGGVRGWLKGPWGGRRGSQRDQPGPGQLQDVQQHLLLLAVLFHSAGEQLEGRALEEGQRLGQRSQLYQEEEVEVAEPLGPLACRQLRVETPPELGNVVTPLLLEPAVWKNNNQQGRMSVKNTL